VKVLLNTEDQCLVGWDALLLVAPFPCDLDRGLYGLCASVHGHDHVEAKHLGSVFSKPGKDIIVECAAAQRQARRLLYESLDKFWVTVALIDGAVGREKIKIASTFGTPLVYVVSCADLSHLQDPTH